MYKFPALKGQAYVNYIHISINACMYSLTGNAAARMNGTVTAQ